MRLLLVLLVLVLVLLVPCLLSNLGVPLLFAFCSLLFLFYFLLDAVRSSSPQQESFD